MNPHLTPAPPGSPALPTGPVERLFPFVLRSRCLLVGRDTLRRSQKRLCFVLITTDLSEGSRRRILQDFRHCPVVQHYTGADLEKFFGLQGTKVVGFARSDLARSILAALKPHLLNRPATTGNNPAPERKPPLPAA